MAFDEDLAAKTRDIVHELVGLDGSTGISMFGGLAFMVNTHMACGVMGPDLMVRVGREGHSAAIGRGAQEMDFTGRPMRGIVVVRGPELRDHEALSAWVGTGVAYAQSQSQSQSQSQPPQPKKTPKGAPRSSGWRLLVTGDEDQSSLASLASATALLATSKTSSATS